MKFELKVKKKMRPKILFMVLSKERLKIPFFCVIHMIELPHSQDEVDWPTHGDGHSVFRIDRVEKANEIGMLSWWRSMCWAFAYANCEPTMSFVNNELKSWLSVFLRKCFDHVKWLVFFNSTPRRAFWLYGVLFLFIFLCATLCVFYIWKIMWPAAESLYIYLEIHWKIDWIMGIILVFLKTEI